MVEPTGTFLLGKSAHDGADRGAVDPSLPVVIAQGAFISVDTASRLVSDGALNCSGIVLAGGVRAHRRTASGSNNGREAIGTQGTVL